MYLEAEAEGVGRAVAGVPRVPGAHHELRDLRRDGAVLVLRVRDLAHGLADERDAHPAHDGHHRQHDHLRARARPRSRLRGVGVHCW